MIIKYIRIDQTTYYAGSDGHIYNYRLKKLRGYLHTKGYLRVSLMVDGQKWHKYVHRLIAECFLINEENKPTINHKNGVKSDNYPDNLEWATYSENNKHAHDVGLQPKNRKSFGRVRNGYPILPRILL